jgi:hypothetical protein
MNVVASINVVASMMKCGRFYVSLPIGPPRVSCKRTSGRTMGEAGELTSPQQLRVLARP